MPDTRSSAERRLAAQIAANARWAAEPDRTAATAPGRPALEARFEAEVDPDGTMNPAERAKRVANARSLYYQRASLAALKERRRQATA